MRGEITYELALKLIDAGRTPLCLLLRGHEDYLKEDLVARAKSKFVPEGLGAFSFSAFDLAECSVNDVLAAAESYPALAPVRLVVVRNVSRLSRSRSERQRLTSRLSSPPNHLALLLLADEPEGRPVQLGTFPDSVKVVHLRPLGDRQFDRWVRQRAAELGLELSAAARRTLIELAGGSMWRVVNELDKLAVNVEGKTAATEEDVLALAGASSQRSAFSLADAVARSNRAAAVKLAGELLDRGESPIALAALLSARLTRPWAGRVRGGPQRGGDFRRRITLACELDSALKRSKLDARLALQLAVDSLTRGAKR